MGTLNLNLFNQLNVYVGYENIYSNYVLHWIAMSNFIPFK